MSNPTNYKLNAVTNVAIRVPITAYITILPKFWKNNAFSILIELSNNIGGNNTIKKNWLNPYLYSYNSEDLSMNNRNNPAIIPIKAVIIVLFK